VNLFRRQSDDADERKNSYEKEENVRNCWKFLPRANQAHFIVQGVILFDDMIAIDEKGDCLFAFPHIFVDFSPESGPFRWFYHSLKIGLEEVSLNHEYEKINFFPKIFTPPSKGKIFKGRSVDLDDVTKRRFRSDYFIKSIFDIEGKYSYLNQRDIVRVPGVESLFAGEETFIEITHKYQVGAKDYLSKHPGDRSFIETQIGRKLEDTDNLTILEFETIPSWRLKDQ